MCLGLEVAVLVLTASDFKTLYGVNAINVLQRFFRCLSKKISLPHIRVLRAGLKPLKNMFINCDILSKTKALPKVKIKNVCNYMHIRKPLLDLESNGKDFYIVLIDRSFF